ncbi:MAG: hypothetical protein KDE14_01830 [Rhodobacteraceae bacterium]|nr:hypothetical protein [Paracoccaceae bacterium]
MENAKAIVLQYMQMIWRQRWLALGAAWTVCTIGWVSVAMLPDKFTSEARFYVDTSSLLNPLLRGISVNADDTNRNQEVAVMQRTLTSRPNIAKVVQMTDMDKSITSDADMESLIDSLEERIKLRSQGTNLFLLEFTDNAPRLARDVVQALLTIFVESSVGNKRVDIQTARSFIEEQIEEYDKQLTDSEQRLADFKVKNIDYFSSSTENFSARLQVAKEGVDVALRERADRVAQRDQLQEQLNKTQQFLDVNTAPQVVVGGAPQTLQQRIAAMQARLDELKLVYTDQHPDVVRVETALKDLLTQQAGLESQTEPAKDVAAPRSQVPNPLYSQLAFRLAEAEAAVSSSDRKVADARTKVDELERMATEAPRIEAEFTSLNRDYQVLKSNYENLLARRESARIAQAADSSTEPVQFRIIAAPEIPLIPAGPMRRIFNIVVFVGGLGAGAGLIILLAQIDGSVRTPEDFEEFGDCGFLGCVSPAVIIEGVRKSFFELHAKFGVVAASLVVMGILFIAISPNLSNLPSRIALMML